jgi:hypothetical protein
VTFYQWDAVSMEVVEWESKHLIDIARPYEAMNVMDREIAEELNGPEEVDSFIAQDPVYGQNLDGTYTMKAKYGHDIDLIMTYHPTDPSLAKAAIESMVENWVKQEEEAAGMAALGHGRNE